MPTITAIVRFRREFYKATVELLARGRGRQYRLDGEEGWAVSNGTWHAYSACKRGCTASAEQQVTKRAASLCGRVAIACMKRQVFVPVAPCRCIRLECRLIRHLWCASCINKQPRRLCRSSHCRHGQETQWHQVVFSS